MPRPRSKQIALSEKPFYHLTYRCVRRSFLCGEIDGFNFEHRRQWIVERFRLLTTMFAIDVTSYAIMMNHCHVLVGLISKKQQLGQPAESVSIEMYYSKPMIWFNNILQVFF